MENFKFYLPIIVGNLKKPIGSVENGFLKIKGVKEKIKLVKKELLKELDKDLKKGKWVEEGYDLCDLYFEGEGRKTTFKCVLAKDNIGENFLENAMDLSDIFNKKIKKVMNITSYSFKFFVIYKEEEVLVIFFYDVNAFVKKFKNNTSIKNKNYIFYNFEEYKKAKQIYIKEDKIYFDGKEESLMEDTTNTPVEFCENVEDFVGLINEDAKCNFNEYILNYKIKKKNINYVKITKNALTGYVGNLYNKHREDIVLIECENVIPDNFNEVILYSNYMKLLNFYKKTNNWYLVKTKNLKTIIIHSDEINKEYHIVLCVVE